MTDELSVLLVDDQQLIRRGLSMLLETVEGIRVIAEAASGEEALAVLRRETVDVVLTDARMPGGMSGMDLVAACASAHPDIPVIVLTTFDDDDVVLGSMTAGAAGFLLKDVSPEQLAEALQSANRGEMVLDPRVTRIALRRDAPARDDRLAVLTPTERTVAQYVSLGWTNAEIARKLVVAEGTVKNHVTSLLRKLGQRDRTGLALMLASGGAGQAPAPAGSLAPTCLPPPGRRISGSR